MIHWSLVIFSDLVFSGHLLKYEMHKAVKQTLKTIDKCLINLQLISWIKSVYLILWTESF